MSDAVERLREALGAERDGCSCVGGGLLDAEVMDTDAAIDAVELTLRRQAAEVDRLNDACNRYALRQADLEAEVERLRPVVGAVDHALRAGCTLPEPVERAFDAYRAETPDAE